MLARIGAFSWRHESARQGNRWKRDTRFLKRWLLGLAVSFHSMGLFLPRGRILGEKFFFISSISPASLPELRCPSGSEIDLSSNVCWNCVHGLRVGPWLFRLEQELLIYAYQYSHHWSTLAIPLGPSSCLLGSEVFSYVLALIIFSHFFECVFLLP